MRLPLLLLLTFLSPVLSAASRNPSATLLLSENLQSLEPDFDTFEYKINIYPSDVDYYTSGQYVRLRLSVSGYLRDGSALSSQEGKWQWLNTSEDQAGIMIVKHFVGGDSSSGVNYCNTTADSDVIDWTTDLSSAGGSDHVPSHTVSDSNIECGISDSSCIRDSNAQALDAFATFELPFNFNGLFRLCYRRSQSYFMNSTSELGWFNPRESQEVNSLSSGDWSAPDHYARHQWQDPTGVVDSDYLNFTTYRILPSGYYWEAAGDPKFQNGDHMVMGVKQTNWFGASQVASTDKTYSDQIKLVPTGTKCIEEVDIGRYPGTVLSNTVGVWADGAFDMGVTINSGNGTMSSTVGYHSNGTDWCPFIASSSPSFTTSLTSSSDYILAFTVLQEGDWDVCYSSRYDRTIGSAFYSSDSKISAKIQSPGGWRKIPRGSGGTISKLTVAVYSPTVTWSAVDRTSDSWGEIELKELGSGTTLQTSAATLHDEITSTSGRSYQTLSGGDQVRVVESSLLTSLDSESPDGCWSTFLPKTSTTDLLGTMTFSSTKETFWSSIPNLNNNIDDRFLHLQFPSSGSYVVCYRSVGEWWNTIGSLLITESGQTNISYHLNDTREGTWGPLQIISPIFDLTTQPYSGSELSIAVTVVESSIGGCQPHSDAFKYSQHLVWVSVDVGTFTDRFASDQIRRDRVSVWMNVPTAASSYYVCIKHGTKNWQSLTSTGLLSPTTKPTILIEMLDRRSLTFGSFRLQSRVSKTSTTLVNDLGTKDEFMLVANNSAGDNFFCGDNSTHVMNLFPTTFTDLIVKEVEYSAAYCPSNSNNENDPCYNSLDQIGFKDGFNTDLYTSTVFHLVTIPNVDTSGYFICYRQLLMNWIKIEPISVEPPHGVNLINPIVELTSGRWFDFHFNVTGGTKFNLLPNKDVVKLVLEEDGCHQPHFQSAISTDLFHPTNSTLSDSFNQMFAAAGISIPVVKLKVNISICLRQHSEFGFMNWIRLPNTILIKPSGVSFSLSTSLVSSGLAHFRFISKGLFDTRPGKDAFSLILHTSYCKNQTGISDLGPSNSKGVATAEALTTLKTSSTELQYRVCYLLSSGEFTGWIQIPEEIDNNILRSFGLSDNGIDSGSQNGIIKVSTTTIEGIFIGRDLFSPENIKTLNTYPLVGGIETSTSLTSYQLSIIGKGFDSSKDKFKFVQNTGTDSCAAEASIGTLTDNLYQIGSNPSWIVPVMTLPFETGLYSACYLWGSLPGPIWIRVPITTLSDVSPYSDIRETRDVIGIVKSDIYFSQIGSGGSLIVIEDHYPSPSLSADSSSRADASDSARIIASNGLCQNITTTTARSSTSVSNHTLLVMPVDDSFTGSSSSFSSVKLPQLEVDWPPSGIHPLKLCYKKQVSSGRVNRGIWLVVSGVVGNQFYITPAVPHSINIVGGSLLTNENKTLIGSEFTVKYQVVGEGGEAVRGNRFIAVIGRGEFGIGSPVTASDCTSSEVASQYGWPSNNTIIRTTSEGIAVAQLTWTSSCSQCWVRPYLLDTPDVTGEYFQFESLSSPISEFSTLPGKSSSGYLEGAVPGNPIYLHDGVSYNFTVVGLTASGRRALASGGHAININITEGGNILSFFGISTSETYGKLLRTVTSGGHTYQPSLDSSGRLELMLHMKPASTFSSSTGGRITLMISSLGQSNRPNAISVSFWVVPVLPVFLKVVTIEPVTSHILPQIWRPEDWPFPLIVSSSTSYPRNYSLSKSTAAPGHYLLRGSRYTVRAKVYDGLGRVVSPEHYASRARANLAKLSLVDSAGGIVVGIQLFGVFAKNGLISIVLGINIGFNPEKPCTVSLTIAGATGEFTTPVRSTANALRITSAIPSHVNAGEDLPDIVIEAVDREGNVDLWHSCYVWPLLSSLNSRRRLSIENNNRQVGYSARQLLVNGRVTFSKLKFTSPASDGISLLSDSGLEIFETNKITVSDNAHKLTGSVSISSTSVSARHKYTITLTVLDKSDVNTTWVREWVSISQISGSSPVVIDGGGSHRIIRSKLSVTIQWTHSCKQCQLQFTAHYRDDWWTNNTVRASWVTPPIAVVAKPIPTQIAHYGRPAYDSVTAKPLKKVENSNVHETGNRTWYEIDRGTEISIPIAAVDDFFTLGDGNSTAAQRTISLTISKQVGDDVYDGTGGAYVTTPLSVRQVGLKLENAKGTITVSFPRPCLQCLITLRDFDIASPMLRTLEILITIKPIPTSIKLWSAVNPEFSNLLPNDGISSTSDSMRWVNQTFVIVDGECIAYLTTATPTAYIETSPWIDRSKPAPIQQQILCSSSVCEPKLGSAIGFFIKNTTIVDQITSRLKKEVSPSAVLLLSGLLPNVRGRMTVLSEGLTGYSSTVSTTWGNDSQAEKFVILSATTPMPPWSGFESKSVDEGYQRKQNFPTYELNNTIPPGRPFPITVQVQDSIGRVVRGSGGTVIATLLTPTGCGDGQPFNQFGTVLEYGNLTTWIQIGSPCENCVVQLQYNPSCMPSACSNTTSVTVPMSQRVKNTPTLNIATQTFTSLLIDTSKSVIQESVYVGETCRLVAESVYSRSGILIRDSQSDVDAYLYNAVISSENNFGTASSKLDSVGEGGYITSQDGLGVLPLRFVNGRLDTEFRFSRICSACVLMINIPSRNLTFPLLTTTPQNQLSKNTKIKVHTRGVRKVLASSLPSSVWRLKNFLVTQWNVDSVGDRDYVSIPSMSFIKRVNSGGNGNGGTLSHTNDGLVHNESNWNNGALTWRLQFSSACLLCQVQVDSIVISIPVLSPAVGIAVTSMIPNSGLFDYNKRLIVSLKTIDNEGNTDYSLSGIGILRLSPSAFEIKQPLLPQLGDGGRILYNETNQFKITNGLSENINISFGEPTFSSFLHFALLPTSSNISSKRDDRIRISSPPQITILVVPNNISVLNKSSEEIYVGNVFRLWIGIVSIDNWVSTSSKGFVDISFSDSTGAANVTISGGNRHRLVDGLVMIEIIAQSLPVDVNSSNCTFEFRTDSATNISTTSLTIPISQVSPSEISWVNSVPPSYAIQDRVIKIEVAVFSDNGLRATRSSGWVGLKQISCTSGRMSTQNQTLDSTGTATFAVTFSGVGECVVKLLSGSYSVWTNSKGTSEFTVVIQKPDDVRFVSNITSDATPILRTGTAYPLVIEIIDKNGNVCLGDYDTLLSVEVVGGPQTLQVFNANTSASGLGSVITVSGPYSDKTPFVASSSGGFVFQLAFSKSTSDELLQFQLFADFRLPGVPPATLSSELITVTVAVTRIVFNPVPQGYHVGGRPFSLSILITDDLQNIPKYDSEVEWRATLSVISQPSLISRFIPIGRTTSLSVMTHLPQVVFELQWSGRDIPVEVEVSSSGIEPATAWLSFQRVSRLRLLESVVSNDIATNYVLVLGVRVVDAIDQTVLGDSLSNITAVVQNNNFAFPIQTNQVSNGITSFKFLFSQPELFINISISLVGSDLNLTFGPFSVVNQGPTLRPAPLVVYVPPVASVLLSASVRGFDVNKFVVSVGQALGLSSANLNVIKICEVPNGSSCRYYSTAKKVLVGSDADQYRDIAIQQTGQQTGGGGGGSETAAAVVDFQVVLTPSQGLVGSFASADIATKNIINSLSDILQNSSSVLSKDIHAIPQTITVTDLQVIPTPRPAVPKPTPMPWTSTPRPLEAPIEIIGLPPYESYASTAVMLENFVMFQVVVGCLLLLL